MSASTLNATHDPALTSWVPSANASDTDFPIQNLPLGRFRLPGELAWRIGTAVGNQVLDLRAAGFIDYADMSTLLQQPSAERQALRAALSAALTLGSRERARLEPCLYAQSAVELGLPCDTRDYWTCPTFTDGYRLESQAGLVCLIGSGAGLSTGGVAAATQSPTVGNPCWV